MKAVNREGQTTVDLANGPVQRVQPWPETIKYLEPRREEQPPLLVLLTSSRPSDPARLRPPFGGLRLGKPDIVTRSVTPKRGSAKADAIERAVR